jgi:hypothetical protein
VELRERSLERSRRRRAAAGTAVRRRWWWRACALGRWRSPATVPARSFSVCTGPQDDRLASCQSEGGPATSRRPAAEVVGGTEAPSGDAPPVERPRQAARPGSTSSHDTRVADAHCCRTVAVVAADGQPPVARFISGGGASGIDWATSTDGGASWLHGSLPAITKFAGNGPYDRVTDSTVADDAKRGVWLIASQALEEATGVWDVLVSRSTDGGLTWGDPVAVALGPDHGSLDSPWIVCDNAAASHFYGHCYVQWTDFQGACSQHVQLSTSTTAGSLGDRPRPRPTRTARP